MDYFDLRFILWLAWKNYQETDFHGTLDKLECFRLNVLALILLDIRWNFKSDSLSKVIKDKYFEAICISELLWDLVWE